MHTPTTTRRGLTLLELIIATAILAVVMGAVFTALNFMTRDMTNEVTSSVLNQESARTLEKLMEKLRAANTQNLPDPGDANLEYFVPVDIDQDGDVLDDEEYIEWGQVGPGGTKLGAVTVVRFTKASTYTEKTAKFDLNRDGDTSDSFYIGHLEEAFYAGSTVTGTPTAVRQLTGNVVIQPALKQSLDLNGDGVNDPIFQQDGNILRIRLFVTNLDETAPPFQKFETSVALRNW